MKKSTLRLNIVSGAPKSCKTITEWKGENSLKVKIILKLKKGTPSETSPEILKYSLNILLTTYIMLI